MQVLSFVISTVDVDFTCCRNDFENPHKIKTALKTGGWLLN
jgi:hypothetical protein